MLPWRVAVRLQNRAFQLVALICTLVASPPAQSRGVLRADVATAAVASTAGRSVSSSPYFEGNKGQAANDTRFVARGLHYQVALKSRGFAVSAPGSRELSIEFAGSMPASVEGTDRLPGRINYFMGSDSREWISGVPTFARVTYREVYPGTDVVVYATERKLEYDFVLAPGADPNQVALRIHGARTRLDHRGAVIIESDRHEMRLEPPVSYQLRGQVREPVASRYVLDSDGTVGVSLERYDPQRTVIIDPVLAFSTYFGSGFAGGPLCCGVDLAAAVASDASGNIYVAGMTGSAGFPTTGQIGTIVNSSVFVAKFTQDGQTLLYSTVFGGSDNEAAEDLAIDSLGQAYVLSRLEQTSTDFPIVGGFQTTHGGLGEAAVTKLSADGSTILWSSFLGGSAQDRPTALALDQAGDVYVTGVTSSPNFPLAGTPYQVSLSPPTPGLDTYDGFVTKIRGDGLALIYSTYLGRSRSERLHDIVVDSTGRAVVAGWTDSLDYPTTAGAFDTVPTPGPGGDAIVTKLDARGSSIVFSTLLAGDTGTDQINSMALDASDAIYLTGFTNSTDFPTVTPIQAALGSSGTQIDAFLTKMNAAGSGLVYSTYLGGADRDFALGVDVHTDGSVVLSGATSSPNFPTVQPFYATASGDLDVFVAKVAADGSSLVYSTYAGGTGKDGILENECCLHSVALDSDGAAIVVGSTFSADFPTIEPYQAQNGGAADVFILKIVDALDVAIDIKPGSFPNSINLGSNGTVAVAILSTVAFDATTVDPLTVTLASAPVKLKGKGMPMASTADINLDGRLDLVVHVSTDALQLSNQDTTADLEGETFSGLVIRGSDSVRIVH